MTTPNQSKFLFAAHRRAAGRAGKWRLCGLSRHATILAAGKITGACRRARRSASWPPSPATNLREWQMRARSPSHARASRRRSLRHRPRAAGIRTPGIDVQRAGRHLHRSFSKGDPLATCWRATRSHTAPYADSFKGGEYEFTWAGLGTLVSGEPKRSKRFNSAGTTCSAARQELWVRRSNTHVARGLHPDDELQPRERQALLFGISSIYDTVAFDGNQIGQMQGADGFSRASNVTYARRAGPILRAYSIRVAQQE